MRVLIVISTLIALTTAQFFGGFSPQLPSLPSVPGVSLVNNFPGFSNVNNFAEFAAQTGKTYASDAEKALREGIFGANKKLVDTHNERYTSGESTMQLGLNPFSDLNPLDIIKRLTGLLKNPKGDAKAAPHKTKAGPPISALVPDSYDWRNEGGVTPVKFQGLDCGACWSFAATGAIEGHYFRKTKNLVTLSEQNLVDCAEDWGNTGCDGGFQQYAFAYVIDNNGISKAQPYPYIEKQDQCKYKDDLKGATVGAFATIDPKDEKKMKEVIATLGPLACSVNIRPASFGLYKSGVYDDEECNKDAVNHSILVVGYGTENGKDYWIIKNSWTDKWGDKGFMKLPRGSNFCGVASECSYPIIE